ncbi:MAG: hypothetical protein IAI50_21515 [Candidatus Eremiobacteraeota bacterium]|nr:hypothetical protein [Candidatus Eremiobacteraeota bacterium]
MSLSFRPFRAAAIVVVALVAFSPSMANAQVKGYGTLIEYAGRIFGPPPAIGMLKFEFMRLIGSGL